MSLTLIMWATAAYTAGFGGAAIVWYVTDTKRHGR